MSNPTIVMGENTSHDGSVITCSRFLDTHGKRWARLGDMVSCPRCKRICPIAQGDDSLIDDGHVACHGCKTACGATLIAGQMFTYTTTPSGAAPGAASSATPGNLLQGFGVIAPGIAGAYPGEAVADGGERYQGRLQPVVATTGEPVHDQVVRVRSTGGQYLNRTTDDEGFTLWVERDVRESLAFNLVQEGTA